MSPPPKQLEPWQVADAARLNALFKERAALSQLAFGATHGIGNQSMVSQYLLGRRPLNIDAAQKFAAGLGVAIADFSPTLAEKIAGASVVSGVEKHWPFDRIKEADIRSLPKAKRDELEKVLASALARLMDGAAQQAVKSPAGTPKGAGLASLDDVENPFPVGPTKLKPWDLGYRSEREEEEAPALLPAISTARDVVANVSAGDHAANDEFEPVPELPDVRLAAGDEGVEVLNEAPKGVLHFRSSFLRQHNANDGRARVVYASGDSMEPVIPNGAAMLLVPTAGLTLRDVASGGVWAINYDGKMLVKTITRPAGGMWVARSFNQAYPDILLENGVDVRVLGRIVWVGAALRNDLQGQWVRR